MASNERFTARQRAPRVHIEYEVETYGSRQKVTLPFVIGVIGDFAARTTVDLPPLRDRDFRDIDSDNFDQVMARLSPRLSLMIANTLSGEDSKLQVDLTFRSREDLTPGRVAYQIEPLAKLLDTRNRMSSLQVHLDGNQALEDILSRLMNDADLCAAMQREAAQNMRGEAIGESDDTGPGIALNLIRRAVPGLSDASREHLETAILDLIDFGPLHDDLLQTLNGIIVQVDRRIGEQLDQVLHHPQFRELEATWSGLWYLVGNTPTGPDLKIRMLHAGKQELQRMARQYRDAAWDQSPLFKRIYEAEFGQLGGQPFGIILCDYAFNHSSPDVDLLRALSQIGASAHVPIIAQAAPNLLGLEDWSELSRPRDIARIFDTTDYAAWRSLRQRPESRYLVLTLPRILGRSIYGDGSMIVEEFDYREQADPSEHVWINAAYGLAVRIAAAHSTFGWYARIQGVEFGGTIDGLPVIPFQDEDGTPNVRGPTEVPVSDRREAEMASAGLVPLTFRKNTDSATFLSVQTINNALQYSDREATLNARLASQLPYVLVASRFAHYLKCMTRDWVGSLRTASEVETDLNNWLVQYIDGQPETSGLEQQARFPLRGGQIEVEKSADAPGGLIARMTINPHYQFTSSTAPSLSIILQLQSSTW